jgi:hypothetical protein
MRIHEIILENKTALSYQRANRYPDGEAIPESLPPVYQPASATGVPSGQKCSSCKHYDKESAKCNKFKGDPMVRPAYWCAKWETKIAVNKKP